MHSSANRVSHRYFASNFQGSTLTVLLLSMISNGCNASDQSYAFRVGKAAAERISRFVVDGLQLGTGRLIIPQLPLTPMNAWGESGLMWSQDYFARALFIHNCRTTVVTFIATPGIWRP